MKFVAYTVYVVTVLLISGFARANAATIEMFSHKQVQQTQYDMPAMINQVAIDGNTGELLVDGHLPNPCYPNPSALLTQDSQNPQVLVVHLSSPVPTTACIARLKEFTTSVELSVLAQFSRVDLDPNATYVLKVDGSDFETQIPGSALMK